MNHPRTPLQNLYPSHGHFLLLLSPFSSSNPHLQALYPKKRTQKHPTRSIFSSFDWQPSPTQISTSPFLSQTLTKVRSNLLPLVWFTFCGHHFILICSTRMLHEKRHRIGESPSLSHRKVHRLQLHYLNILSIR